MSSSKTTKPAFPDRIDKRMALIHKSGVRLFPYKEQTHDGSYAFVVGTGKSGGKKAGQEIFVETIEELVREVILNERAVAARPLDKSKPSAKFLAFGPHITGYELVHSLTGIVQAARHPPSSLLGAPDGLEDRAEQFSKRAVRPEQAAFHRKVFIACEGKCVVRDGLHKCFLAA